MTPPIMMVERSAAIPLAPPADKMSSAIAKVAPNWVLKTTMAATGTVLALMLAVRLVFNLWFFTGQQHYDTVATRVANLFTPYVPATTWLWFIRVVTLLLIAAHVAICVVLLLRSKAGRGPVRAKLHGGFHAWLTRLMPYTGAALGLFALVYVLDQVFGLLVFPVVFNGPPPDHTQVWAYWNLTNSLSHPALAVVYILGLLAIAAHVLHGLGTVMTIAAGGSQLGARIKRWLVIGGGALMSALLLASLLIPVGVLAGWFR